MHSDDWGAYIRLQQLLSVIAHQVVVYVHDFVDSRTSVHTQKVESTWSQLNLLLKQRKGITREDLQSYLNEWMWRQWRGGNHLHRMCNFLAILPLHFPTDTPDHNALYSYLPEVCEGYNTSWGRTQGECPRLITILHI